MTDPSSQKNYLQILTLFLILISASLSYAGHLHKEKEYQQAWCAKMGGQLEVVLDDGTRVDCLTDEYAIEFDFGRKWAESVGQALYYALKTGRKPGIVLILEKDSDKRYLRRLQDLRIKYNFDLWTVDQLSLQ